MSFLTPLYLLAGLAILAPILAHLVRKQPREVMDFSSTLFVDDAPPSLTNRNRIDQWLLLALRSVILLALALAFARPYLNTLVEQKGRKKPSKERILLVDASASMRREGVWEQAIQKAKDYVAKCEQEDSIAVYAMTDRLEPHLSLDQSRQSPASGRQALAYKSLDALIPTWCSSDLGQGMVQALAMFKDDETPADANKLSEIAIVSDFQQGSSLAPLGSIQWPSDLPVVPIVCQPKNAGNATLSILAQSKDQAASDPADFERVAVRNSAKSKAEKLKLTWLDDQGQPLKADALDLFIPAGQQQIVNVRRPQRDASDQDSPLILQLEGDDQPFDNRQYVYRGNKESTKAVCIDNQESDPKESLAYFANLVPLSQPGLDVTWEILSPTSPPPEKAPTDWRWVIASSRLNPAWAQTLKPSIEEGLHVLWVLDRPVGAIAGRNDLGAESSAGDSIPSADPQQLQRIWSTWFPEDTVEISEAASKRFHLLQAIDMSHPIFATFADPKFNDFTKIRFWRHRTLTNLTPPAWKVIASFDDGHPAILQRAVGKGMVTILASGWQPPESQLALSSKYVPILASMFDQASPPRAIPDYRCGDALPSTLADELWRSSTGDQIQAAIAGATTRFEIPGIFRADKSDALIAVNIPRSEGLTDPIEFDEFSRFGVSMETQSKRDIDRQQATQINQLAEELEASQNGWWWILLLVLLFAGLESLIAATRSRFPGS